MTRVRRPLVTRLGRAPAAEFGRPPPGLPVWVGAMALLGALTVGGCDDGGDAGAPDRGSSDAVADASGEDAQRPDMMPLDAMPSDMMAPDAMLSDMMVPDAMPSDMMIPDAMPSDAMPSDAMPPDAALPLQAVAPAVTAGGSTVESGRYRLRLAVGGPSPMHVTSSERLKARIGVALPLPQTEEHSR